MPLPAAAGLGFKPDHFETIRALRPRLGFFEVHAENYMGAGGPPHRQLAALRADYAISLHGVGLSIGGPGRLDPDHLARLRRLIDRYQPESFSEHLAWSSHGAAYLNDLLPLPYTEETLALVCDHIDEVQERLGCRMLLENPSTYIIFEQTTLTETGFLRAVAQRTGCGLLLDVNNVFVSATNHRSDPRAYLADYPLDRVAEIHLGGHAAEDLPSGPLLIDAHGSPVADPVWTLYAEVIARTGPLPTLVEWDNDVPEFPVLLAEARQAQALLNSGGIMRKHAEDVAALHDGLFSQHLPAGVTARTPQEAGRRFAVYRNNVMHSLTTALGQRFPVIERLVGQDFFRAMAAEFIQRHPPSSPVLLEWGADYPGFLEGFPPVAALPYLADVARIELLRGAAYHAADADPAPTQALAQAAADPGRARLRLHPSVGLLHSPHAAFSIWQANQPGAAARPLRSDREEAGMILRDRAMQVQVMPLSIADHAFVAALSRQDTLLDAGADAARHQPEHEAGPLLLRLIALGSVIHIATERV